MRKSILKFSIFLKGLFLFVRPHLYLGWLSKPLRTLANGLDLSKWIADQNTDHILNDFYTSKRIYPRRFNLYTHVIDTLGLKEEEFIYLEFGVSKGHSFRWWLEQTSHPGNLYYGFDTFEGLPEKWGMYDKGDMIAQLPEIDDRRGSFVKGLFQDTLPGFLANHDLDNGNRKIIHLDADLFSATLYVLTCLDPYLKKGDVLIFDEFNVPNHEFFAFKMFADSYYRNTRLIGAVNNYLQVAMIIEE